MRRLHDCAEASSTHWPASGVHGPQGATSSRQYIVQSHLLPLQRLALVRLRVGSYHLRIAMGHNEGDGSANALPGRALGTSTSQPPHMQGAGQQGLLRICITFCWGVRFLRKAGSRGVWILASRLPQLLCWGSATSTSWQRRFLRCCSSGSAKAGTHE